MKKGLTFDELKRIYKRFTSQPLDVIDYRYFTKLPKNDFILYYPSIQDDNGNISGHYVCIIQTPKIIYYYDSYGNEPNYMKRFKNTDKKFYMEQRSNFINELLKSNKIIDYNNYKHQEISNNVATCGRHSLMRLLNRNKNTEQYNNFIKESSKNKNITSDEFVLSIIN